MGEGHHVGIAKAGLDAHVQSINAAGGINGRKIEVQFCNDAFNANTGAACARTREAGIRSQLGWTPCLNPCPTG